jgi:hypothetical protein
MAGLLSKFDRRGKPGWGGKRKNAGRKSLSERDRWDIGQACEDAARLNVEINIYGQSATVSENLSTPRKRLKGSSTSPGRKAIILLVAKQFNKAKPGITERMVDRCWKECRARKRAGNPLSEQP